MLNNDHHDFPCRQNPHWDNRLQVVLSHEAAGVHRSASWQFPVVHRWFYGRFQFLAGEASLWGVKQWLHSPNKVMYVMYIEEQTRNIQGTLSYALA